MSLTASIGKGHTRGWNTICGAIRIPAGGVPGANRLRACTALLEAHLLPLKHSIPRPTCHLEPPAAQTWSVWLQDTTLYLHRPSHTVPVHPLAHLSATLPSRSGGGPASARSASLPPSPSFKTRASSYSSSHSSSLPSLSASLTPPLVPPITPAEPVLWLSAGSMDECSASGTTCSVVLLCLIGRVGA